MLLGIRHLQTTYPDWLRFIILTTTEIDLIQEANQVTTT